MANLSWISSNPDYINQMIRNTQVTLSNNYNDLDNIPIIKITSTTNNPQKIWELKEGLYMINGVVQVDNSTSYEVSNLLISMTARLENGKYILSAFIPYLRGLFEYILKTNSTEYEQHQKIVLMIKNDTLTLDNETIYTPIEDYHPATKKYVDDKTNEIVTELDRMGVNKENLESLNKENRIRDIKLQALLSETSDRNITIEENVRYFDMPLSIDNGIVTINEIVGETLVNVCDQEESVAITKSYTVENENHIALQGEYDGKCRPVIHGNTLVNHNADWDDSLQTGVETSASGIEDVQVEGTKGQEVSVVVEGNTVLNHALGKTSAVVSSVEDNLIDTVNINPGGWIQASSSFNPKLTNYKGSLLIINNSDKTVRFQLSNLDGSYASQIMINSNTTASVTIEEDKLFRMIQGHYNDGWADSDVDYFKENVKIFDATKYVNSNNGNYVDLTVANDMSSVVEIEGRTMVNVCDQKDPVAITKSYTVENSGNHIALQGEYDGKCRPVIQGNTMVNLFNISDIYESQGMSIDNNIIILTEENIWAHFGSYIPALKPSTLYTFVVNIIENTTNDVIYINNAGEGQTYFPEIPWKSVTEVGTYIYTVTTASDLTNLRYSVRTNPKGTGYVKLQIMLFEGDLTQTPELVPTEYVEGLKSSFEDELIPTNLKGERYWTNINDFTDISIAYDEVNDIVTFVSSSFVDKRPQIQFNDSKVELNKGYTVFFNILENTLVRDTGNSVGKFNVLNYNYGYMIPKGEIGLQKIYYKPVNEQLGSKVYLELQPNVTGTLKVSNIIILEGDWTHLTEEDLNHLGKYKVEYKVIGKNKLKEVIASQGIDVNTGSLYSNAEGSMWKTTKLIQIKPNTAYACSVTSMTNKNINYIYYDKDEKYLHYQGFFNSLSGTLTSHKNAYYMRLRLPNEDLGNIQLEEGTQATEYEPYKEYTKTFYLNSPLLEGDTIEDVNGVATHVKRYGKVVLDGVVCDEVTKYALSGLNDDVSTGLAFYVYTTKKPAITGNDLDMTGVYSDNFKNINPYDAVTPPFNKHGVSLHKSVNELRFVIAKNVLNEPTLDGVIQWFQANPTTVVYELASPIYEPISTESILCDSYVNGHLDFDSAVPVEKVRFSGWGTLVKYLYPSTKYIVQFESDNVGKLSHIGLNWSAFENLPVVKGINKFTVTLGDTLKSTFFELSGIGFNASNIVVTEAIDADFEYFEGLSSTYESCYPGGKNLFDGVWIIGEGIDASTGLPWIGINRNRTDFIEIKPNTNYVASGASVLTSRFYDKNKQIIPDNVGINKSSPSNAKYLRISIDNMVDFSKFQLEEGSTATSYEPFIDKYKVDVKVIGENLCPNGSQAVNVNLDTGSEYYGATNCRMSDYVRFDSSVTYSYKARINKGEPLTAGVSARYYDINKNYIGGGVPGNNVPLNAHYIRCRYLNTNLTNSDVVDFMMTEAYHTNWVEYFESTKTFYLNSPLLEGDKIVTKNGKVYHYHKMGMVELDGSENWRRTDNAEITQVTRRYRLDLSEKFPAPTPSDYVMPNAICDTHKLMTFFDCYRTDNLGISVYNKSGVNCVYIRNDKTLVDEFKTWLQANPTTVVYELASPYYELIDEYNNTILNIPKNVAHLTHTSAVPVNNTVFTNYKDELNVLEANTQYRVMFDCDKANVPFTVTLGGTSQTVTSKKGTHSLLITTPSTLVDKNLVIDGTGRCGIDNIRIFKGKVEYDYVKGLWSGYEERKLDVSYKDNKSFTLINSNKHFYDKPFDNNTPYKPNTTYTYLLYVNTFVCDRFVHFEFGNTYGDTDPTIWINNYSCNIGKKCIKVFKLTTKREFKDNYKENRCYIGKGKDNTNIENCDIQFALIILEGDWTDNPPTYEEVMANEGKYAVKVKLDTNANVFGKGGRL